MTSMEEILILKCIKDQAVLILTYLHFSNAQRTFQERQNTDSEELLGVCSTRKYRLCKSCLCPQECIVNSVHCIVIVAFMVSRSIYTFLCLSMAVFWWRYCAQYQFQQQVVVTIKMKFLLFAVDILDIYIDRSTFTFQSILVIDKNKRNSPVHFRSLVLIL